MDFKCDYCRRGYNPHLSNGTCAGCGAQISVAFGGIVEVVGAPPDAAGWNYYGGYSTANSVFLASGPVIKGVA